MWHRYPNNFVPLHGLTINITRRGRRNADWKYVFLERRRKRGRQRCYPTTEKNRHTYALHRQTCFRQTYVYIFIQVTFFIYLFFMPIWDTPWNFQEAYQGWGQRLERESGGSDSM